MFGEELPNPNVVMQEFIVSSLVDTDIYWKLEEADSVQEAAEELRDKVTEILSKNAPPGLQAIFRIDSAYSKKHDYAAVFVVSVANRMLVRQMVPSNQLPLSYVMQVENNRTTSGKVEVAGVMEWDRKDLIRLVKIEADI